ncbi:MAG: hypothetical protein ACKVOA_01725 [Methylophilaceae bacterium]
MSNKIAIIVLADSNSDEGLGRIVNALAAAGEYNKAGDEVRIVFTGTGTKWPTSLVKPDHPAHGLYEDVKDLVDGACGFCANAFGQTDAMKQYSIKLLADSGPFMSYRQFTQAGYQILTF